MPFLPHTLVAWGGVWNDAGLAAEQWVCTLRLAGRLDAADEVHQELCDDIAAQVVLYHQASMTPALAHLKFVKVNGIAPDGKYHKPNHTFEKFYAGTAGGGAGAVLPLQNTVVNTLLTNRQRGLASRGRFYPPGVRTTELDGSKTIITNTAAGARADQAVDLIDGINTVAATFEIGPVSVCSSGGASGSGTGVSAPVLEVSTGLTVDTQRRRRAQLTEFVRQVRAVGA